MKAAPGWQSGPICILIGPIGIVTLQKRCHILDLIGRIISDILAFTGLSDLSWGVAIIGTPIFVAGLGLEEAGKRLSSSTQIRAIKLLVVSPLIGLGYILMGIAALLIILNMLGLINR